MENIVDPFTVLRVRRSQRKILDVSEVLVLCIQLDPRVIIMRLPSQESFFCLALCYSISPLPESSYPSHVQLFRKPMVR